MREKASAPETVILALLVLLVAGGIALGGGSSSSGAGGATAGAEAVAARVTPIAHRVERIRGLRFKKLPKPQIVPPSQVRKDVFAKIDREKEEEIESAGRIGVLLGLLPPGTDLVEVTGELYEGQVVGYYDPQSKRMAIVEGPAAGDNVGSEITLAHELDHALDDQHFDLDRDPSLATDDGTLAFSALTEGTATSVMTDYTRRHIGAGASFGSAVSSLSSGAGDTSDIPPYLLNTLLFTYLSGQKFVERLRSVAHGWKLVDYAFARRAPRSTEQVIHPEKYLVDERPVAVGPALPRRLFPDGWRRHARGTFGEFDTHQLVKLALDDADAKDAAAGWGGGRYELWTAPAGSRGAAVVVRWTWDTRADAGQFARALRSYASAGVADGEAAVRASGLRTTLAVAENSATAERLAKGAAARR
jgi:hypothetical protein